MTSDRGNAHTCLRCGSSNIIEGIETGQLLGDGGQIGLSHNSSFRFLPRCVSPLYADLCQDCGTIVRFFVEGTDKPWIRRLEF